MGVIYPPSFFSSITLHPGALLRILIMFSKSYKLSNSILIDSEWPVLTGTRTQVAVTSMSSSNIFFV